MHSDAETLEALMARLADGDRAAFSPVFERLWGPLSGMCARLLGSEADGADAAQEALQKILVRAADYQRGRPVMPWAMAIAGWECRTLARQRTRRREAPAPVEERAGEHPERALIERDLAQAAVAALGALSEHDRDALIATYWDEAAAVEGATLRKRRSRALGRLREVFRRIYGLD